MKQKDFSNKNFNNEKYFKNYFSTILKEEITSIKTIKEGFSNGNFLINNKYVARIPLKNKDQSITYDDELKVYNELKNKNICEDLLYFNTSSGVKITKYLPNFKSYKYKPNNSQIALLAKKINQLHSIKTSISKKYDMISRLFFYKNKIDKQFYLDSKYEKITINQIANLEANQKYVLTHSDLVKGNILFSKNNVILIDFEYSLLNSIYFDLASFISENNINNMDSIYFLKQYFKKDNITIEKEIVKAYINFLDYLYYYWALYMYKNRNYKIYKDIADIKLKRINKTIYSYKH